MYFDSILANKISFEFLESETQGFGINDVVIYEDGKLVNLIKYIDNFDFLFINFSL